MKANIVVVKLGSSVLASADGQLNMQRLEAIAALVNDLKAADCKPVLVSSGAVAAGFSRLGLLRRPRSTKARQAAAAAGQGALIQAWQESFEPYAITVAQLLLTQADFTRRQSFQNALATIEYLLSKNALPIVNENDTIATEELTFGDNDMLAALVAMSLQASKLFLFTSVDAVYTSNPAENTDAQAITELDTISQEMLRTIGTSSSALGTGGMHSKLVAASLASSMGVPVCICSGLQESFSAEHLLSRTSPGTNIHAKEASQSRKKQWIAMHAECTASVVIDQGACRALLHDGRSLLSVGVLSCEQEFSSGDVITVKSEHGIVLGKGISRMCTDEVLRSSASTSGSSSKETTLIHRNDWVRLSGGIHRD